MVLAINRPAVTVYGVQGVLDSLYPALSAWGHQLECREIGELLAPYDRNTREGESQLREVERTYSALRGQLLVRLLVVDLNPESEKELGECPLQRAIDDWTEIDRRRTELLKERHEEKMSFVTILVVESGELRGEKEEMLLRLAGKESGSPKQTARAQRVYLMTRLLELGESQTVHAKDAWPQFVAGLLCHIQWDAVCQNKERDVKIADSKHGLFAWRTCRIMASIDERILKSQTKAIFEEVNKRLLLKENHEPLLPSKPFSPSDTPSAFDPNVVNDYEGKPWSEIEAVRALAQMSENSQWQKSATRYALHERKHLLQLASDRDSDKSVGKDLLDNARRKPANLFPGRLADQMPDFIGLSRDSAETIQRKQSEADKALTKLHDWAEDHDLAAQGFVTVGERILAGLAVGMALSYSLVAVCWVLAQFLPGLSAEVWLLGGVLALSSISGITLVLGVGYVLQRKRGMVAHLQLKSQADRWISAVVTSKEELAKWMRRSFEFRTWLVGATNRALLRHRLWRVEQVLQNELHGPSDGYDIRSPLPDEDDEILRYLQLQVKALNVAELAEEQKKQLVTEMEGRFIEKWSKYLENDGSSGGLFLPISPLFRVCNEHTNDISAEVRDILLEEVVEKIQRDKEKKTKVREELEQSELFGNSANLFSVDINEGTTHEHVYHREHLHEVFDHQSVEKKSSLDEKALGAGVLAMWFGECQLVPNGTDDQDRIQFVAATRH